VRRENLKSLNRSFRSGNAMPAFEPSGNVSFMCARCRLFLKIGFFRVEAMNQDATPFTWNLQMHGNARLRFR
jgi:hypothetical protein